MSIFLQTRSIPRSLRGTTAWSWRPSEALLEKNLCSKTTRLKTNRCFAAICIRRVTTDEKHWTRLSVSALRQQTWPFPKLVRTEWICICPTESPGTHWPVKFVLGRSRPRSETPALSDATLLPDPSPNDWRLGLRSTVSARIWQRLTVRVTPRELRWDQFAQAGKLIELDWARLPARLLCTGAQALFAWPSGNFGMGLVVPRAFHMCLFLAGVKRQKVDHIFWAVWPVRMTWTPCCLVDDRLRRYSTSLKLVSSQRYGHHHPVNVFINMINFARLRIFDDFYTLFFRHVKEDLSVDDGTSA